MPLTKVTPNNLHTTVQTMVTTMVNENAVDSADVTLIVNSNIAAKSTSDLSEGSNLYHTNARADARADLRITNALNDSITITSTDAGSSAGPDLILYRNSATPADGDYIGQIQFKGRQDGPGDEIYAKVTGKISDASNGTEDGLIETAIKGNGSFTIVSRQKSNELQLINGVGLSVAGNTTLSGTLNNHTIPGGSGTFAITSDLYQDSDVGAYIAGNRTYGNITTTGYIAGPATMTIDPAAVGDNTGTLVVAGNLQVDGTTTTINSTTVAIDDLNFSIATDAASSAAANGAGITVGGAGATLVYTHATTSWDMNKPLNVTGIVTSDGLTVNNGVVKGERGTASAPAYSFHDDADTGMFNISNTDLGFSVGGSERLRIDSSGRVGIGTDSPGAKLHLDTASVGMPKIRFTHTNANGDNFEIGTGVDGVSNGGWSIRDIDASVNRFVIDSSGNVGIGTSSPNGDVTKFGGSVKGLSVAAGQPAIAVRATGNAQHVGYLGQAGSNTYLGALGGGDLFFQTSTSGTTRMTIKSNGNVGIGSGTFTPSTMLDVRGNVAVAYDSGNHALRLYNSGRSNWSSLSNMQTGTGADLVFKSGTGTMTYTHSGNLGIGDSSPTSRLSISKGSARTTDFENMLKITHTSSGTTGVGFGSAIYFLGERNNGVVQGMGRLIFDAEVNSGTDISSGFSVQTATAGSPSEKFRITHDGKVGIGTTTPNYPLEVEATATSSTDIVGFSNSNGVAKHIFGLENVGAGTYRLLDASNNNAVFFSGHSADNSYINAGNVGIGTASPATSYGKVLHIHDTGTSGANLRLTDATSGAGTGNGLDIIQLGVDSYFINREAGDVNFYTNGQARFTIHADGHLGFGDGVLNDSPWSNVFGARSQWDTMGIIAATDGSMQIGHNFYYDAANTTGYKYVASGKANRQIHVDDYISWETTDTAGTAGGEITMTEKMRLTSNGNVGIGTNNPQKYLHMQHGSTNTFTPSNDSWHSVIVHNNASATTNTAGIAFEVSGSAYHGNAGTGIAAVKNGTASDYGADLAFITRPQSAVAEERMRITDDGKVGIGTSSPSSPKFSSTASGILELKGSKPSFNVQESDVTNAHFNMSMSGGIAYLGATGTGNLILATGTSTWAERMRIDATGNVGIGTGGTLNDKLVVVAGGTGILVARHWSGTATSGQGLGEIGFKGYASGNSTLTSDAKIGGVADGAHSGSSAPARLEFYVKHPSTGPGSAPTRRMQLSSYGELLLEDGANNWASFYMNEQAGIRYHVKRFYTGSSGVTENVMRVKRHYWGSGFYKISVKQQYYSTVSEQDFYINGHGRNDGSYSPSYSLTYKDIHNGSNGRIGLTSPVASSPGNSAANYVDAQISIPAYTHWIVVIEAGGMAGYSQSVSSMSGNDMYALH